MTAPAESEPRSESDPRLEELVPAAIEAIEGGDPDPVPRLCGDDAPLAESVRGRLRQLAAHGLLAETAATLPAAIGPYRVLAELGTGGMGVVYLAEQVEPVRRQVAVKVIKLGMDTREVVARFQAERQALALMNHPHVAQVFDAGATADGRPYFVMELVPGEPITDYCDARTLPVRARVQLFAAVARAVQHAHDKGVIHRDLKPTNVLVAEHQGRHVPKIIDFGIAKAAAASSGATQVGHVLGTPEYMSPEQARSGGVDVDVRTDVWSLGVLLYVLLCGDLPFDPVRLRRSGRNELERILDQEPATQPSTRLSTATDAVAIARGSDARTLARAVRGELDWIVLRALAKDRGERYPSPLALAEDLERWLAHEPVHAGPPGRVYRLRKFVRRHRVPVAAAAAVLVALVAGLATSLAATASAVAAQRQEAAALADVRAFFELARAALGDVVAIADDRLRSVPKAEPVRRAMLEDALRYYQGLRSRRPQDPDLRLELTRAVERTSVILRELGRTQQAEEVLLQGLAEADDLVAAAPHHSAPLQLRATLRGSLHVLQCSTGRPRDAERTAAAALADLRALAGRPDVDAGELAVIEAGLRHNMGLERDDDPAAASAEFAAAIASYQQAVARHPGRTRLHVQLALCRVRHGELLSRRGDHAGAEQALQAAVDRLTALRAERPADDVRQPLAAALARMAALQERLGRLPAAVAAQTQALALQRALAEEHPDLLAHAIGIADSLHFLASAAQQDRDFPRAFELYRQALAARERVAAAAPDNPRSVLQVAKTLFMLASAQIDACQGRIHAVTLDDVVATLTRCQDLVAKAREAAPQDREIVTVFASAAATLATVLALQGRGTDAEREYERAGRDLEELVAAAPRQVEFRYHLASLRNNEWQTRTRAGDDDGAARAAASGLEHAYAGAELDPLHAGLQELLPQLVARRATTFRRTGDELAALQEHERLLAAKGVGTRARHSGALLLAHDVRELAAGPERTGWLARARAALQAAIAELPAAGRDARAVELAVALAQTCEAAGDAVARDAALATGLEVLRKLERVPPDQARNLLAQCVEAALARRDAGAAAASTEELLQRVGLANGACYTAAVLFARSAALAAGGERDRLCARSVECLREALARREVGRVAARHENLAVLRGRADYEALVGER